MADGDGARHIDHRISMYQPMAAVELHAHAVQEQVYHVLEGEGLIAIGGEKHALRKHDYAFLPPGVKHPSTTPGRPISFSSSSPPR